MNRYQTLALYGAGILITGVIIFILGFNPSKSIQFSVAAGMIVSAFFAFLTAYKSKNLKIPLKYHNLQGVIMIAYGLVILFFGNSIERFLTITSGFMIFLGFTEIIFSYQLLMTNREKMQKIALFRLVIGFLTAFGAMLILANSSISLNNALFGSGVAFIFSGIGFMIFSNLIKKIDNIYSN